MTFGLSIIIQNGLLEVFSADSRRLSAGDLETASLPLGGGLAIGLMPLITLGCRRRGDRRPQPAVLPHARSAAPSAPSPTSLPSRS